MSGSTEKVTLFNAFLQAGSQNTTCSLTSDRANDICFTKDSNTYHAVDGCVQQVHPPEWETQYQ